MKGKISGSLNPDLHIVVTIEKCDYVPKRVLKFLKYQLQIFLVKDRHLESLHYVEPCASNPYDLYEDQALKVLLFLG